MKWVNPGTRTILVVEPHEPTAMSVAAILGTGFRTFTARSGREGIVCLKKTEPNLVLLALLLPDMEGLDLCRFIGSQPSPPVVFVAGRDVESNALASYAAGADGYLPTPYRLREVDARIRAALRRAPATVAHHGEVITAGEVTLSHESHEVRVRGRLVELPLREFELLGVLLARPGKIWGRDALMARIWGERPASGTKSLDVHVRRIRGRIEDDPSRPTRILTVRGVGYQYAVPAPQAAYAGL